MFNQAARIRIQITEPGVWCFSAEPDKGDPDEIAAIEMIESLANYLEKDGRMVKRMYRNMRGSEDRVDRIVV